MVNKLLENGNSLSAAFSILDHHRDGLIIVDADLNLLFANDNAYTLLKVAPDQDPQTIEQDFQDIILGFADLVRKAERSTDGTTETRRVKIDGHATYVEVFTRTFRLEDNTGLVLFSCKDISEDVNWRHVMRTSLQQNTEMVRAIAETVPVGLTVTDNKGRITAVNSRLCAMLGYSSEDLLNEPFTVLLPEEQKEIAEKKYHWFLAGAGEAEETEDLQHHDGSQMTLDVTTSTFMGRNGHPYKVTCYHDPS